MGMDLYVGSLTRYMSGDWTLSTQRWAEELGIPFGILGSHQTQEPEKRDPRPIRKKVLAWRAGVARRLEAPLDWDESDGAPCFTEKPGRAWSSLLIWAAHEEHPALERPTSSDGPSYYEDPAYLASGREGFVTRYPHLLRSVDLWIPSLFDAPFQSEAPWGKRAVIGSGPGLLEELHTLNARTWRADLDRLGPFIGALPDAGVGLSWDACCAFSNAFTLARLAARHRLPMVVDV